MARRADGFTLIEVLVSILVLATTMAGVASLAATAARARHLGRQRTMLMLIGMREIESLRAGISSGAGVEYFDGSGRSLGATRVGGAVYVAAWQSSSSPADSAISLIRLRAAVAGGSGAAPPAAPSGAPNVVWLVATIRNGL